MVSSSGNQMPMLRSSGSWKLEHRWPLPPHGSGAVARFVSHKPIRCLGWEQRKLPDPELRACE